MAKFSEIHSQNINDRKSEIDLFDREICQKLEHWKMLKMVRVTQSEAIL